MGILYKFFEKGKHLSEGCSSRPQPWTRMSLVFSPGSLAWCVFSMFSHSLLSTVTPSEGFQPLPTLLARGGLRKTQPTWIEDNTWAMFGTYEKEARRRDYCYYFFQLSQAPGQLAADQNVTFLRGLAAFGTGLMLVEWWRNWKIWRNHVTSQPVDILNKKAPKTALR